MGFLGISRNFATSGNFHVSFSQNVLTHNRSPPWEREKEREREREKHYPVDNAPIPLHSLVQQFGHRTQKDKLDLAWVGHSHCTQGMLQMRISGMQLAIRDCAEFGAKFTLFQPSCECCWQWNLLHNSKFFWSYRMGKFECRTLDRVWEGPCSPADFEVSVPSFQCHGELKCVLSNVLRLLWAVVPVEQLDWDMFG